MEKTFRLWDNERKMVVEVKARRVGREWRAFCPKHPDREHPNLDINEEKGVYLCRACQWKGRLMEEGHQNPGTRKQPKALKLTDHKELEQKAKEYAKSLGDNSDFKMFLKENRGISDAIIERYRLGYVKVHPEYTNSGERLTIPIYKDGKCVNIRFHSFEDKEGKDLPYTAGLPYATWLFPEDQLTNEELWLCEGEPDTLCAVSRGLHAITVTGGAGTWRKEFTPLFKGKKVKIAYDCDAAGRKGASKVAEELSKVTDPNILDLGIEGEDLTNFLVDHEKNEEELREIAARGNRRRAGTIEAVVLEIDDFRHLELPEKKTLLHPWLTEQSIILVTGWRGVGKTWFGMAILNAIARAIPFGPWQTITSVPCLFFDGEMPADDTRKRFIFLNPDGKKRSPLFVYSEAYASNLGLCRADLLDQGWQAEMKNLLISRGIKLWVIDNIASLTSGIDENSKKDWDPVNRWLLELRFAGISTMLLHHLGKSGDQRGTSAREDNIDISIALSRPPGYASDEGAKFNLAFTKARVPTESLKLIGDLQLQLIADETGKPIWTWASAEKKKKNEILKMINEGMINKDIAETLSISPGYVSRIKRKAVHEDCLTKKGKLTQTGLSVMSEDR